MISMNDIIKNAINKHKDVLHSLSGITKKKCKRSNCQRMAQNKSGYCALHGKNKNESTTTL